jgi:hypothetical protein
MFARSTTPVSVKHAGNQTPDNYFQTNQTIVCSLRILGESYVNPLFGFLLQTIKGIKINFIYSINYQC